MDQIHTKNSASRNNLLSRILNNEAKEAQYGAIASKLRKEYAKKYAPIKPKEKVFYHLEIGNRKGYGIVDNVYFNTSTGWTYVVYPTDKNFNKSIRRNAIWLSEKGKNKGVIQIVKEL